MSFDEKWFETLSKLDENVVDSVAPSGPNRAPRVKDAIEQRSDLLNREFLEPLASLVDKLQDRDHVFGSQFRLEGQHVYTYPQGRAYKCQKNVGFWARETRKMRIGYGLRFGGPSDLNSDSTADFIGPIHENPDEFNALYKRLGSYHEPGDLPKNPQAEIEEPSDYFTQQRPRSSGWMFFGACLTREEPAHRWLFEEVARVADFAAEVLDVIEESPFG